MYCPSLTEVWCSTVPGPLARGPGPRPPAPGVASRDAGRRRGGRVLRWVVLGGALSALALLVAQVLADHHDPAVPPDHLALVADLLDARLDLHRPAVCSWVVGGRACGGAPRSARPEGRTGTERS